MDTYADDLAELMEALDLKDTILVGHSTGGGVVARYIGRHGARRVTKVVLIGSVTPLVMKTADNPTGTPIEVLNGFRQAVLTNRAQFFRDLAVAYFGSDIPGANISEDLLNSCWQQDMLTGRPAAYFAIKALSETDLSEDLKAISVPTLILHGDADKIVPVSNAYRSSKLIPNATLKIYTGAPHALIALPDWRLDLQVFQQSGASIVEQAYRHLYFNNAAVKPLAARLPYVILDTTRVTVMLIQAAIFALVPFGIVYLWQLQRPLAGRR